MIDVYDNLLEPEIAEQISKEMRTLMWSFEHPSNPSGVNVHWNIPSSHCGKSIEEMKKGQYSDILLPIWNAIVDKQVAYKYRVTEFRRCYMNAHTHGVEPHIHRDDGDITMIYYPIMKWKTEWGGGTSVYDNDDETKIPTYVPYIGNRLLTFSASLPHQAMPVARVCYQLRSVIVFKCDVNNI